MADKNPHAGFVPLLPLSPGDLGVYLELQQGAGDTPECSFVRLPGDSPHTRCLQGAVLSASGHVLARVVVKLRQEESAEGFFPDDELETASATQDAWWTRLLADLGRLQGGAPCFPDLLLPAADAAPLPMLPPLLFCSLSRRLFPFFCPTCLGPLEACRNDARLAAAGLPLHTTSSQRLLTCPGCRAAGRDEPFYMTSPPANGELPAGVVGLSELQRGWAAAAGRLPEAFASIGAPPPCIQCAIAGACLAPGAAGGDSPARKRPRSATSQPAWSIFLSHDSPYIVTRLVPSTFDAMADRIGGRSGEETPGIPGQGGFLFGDDGAGLDAVEVLALKLGLFLQVMRALREYHRRLGIPHLDLHPDHILVDPGESGEFLPALWNFRVRLLGASGARELALGSKVKVLLPPREVKAPFAAPRVRELTMQTRRRGELLIERVLPEPDNPETSRIEAILRDPHGITIRPSTHDWLWVSIPDGVEELGVALVPARVDPRLAAGSGGGIRITSEPVPILATARRRIERAGGMLLPLVRYRVYPQLADVDDAFSLGVILFRLLLVNDQQDLSSVADLVASTVRRATASAPVPVRSGSFLVESALGAALSAHPQVLAKHNLFYRQIDRSSERPNAVPDSLWRGVLMVAFRLLEMGLNPATCPAAIDPARLDPVLSEAEGLWRQLSAVLFRRQGLNLEVQALIEELIAADPGRMH